MVVLAFALILASYVLIWTGYTVVFPYLQNVWQFLTFLVGPSLYLYLKDTFKEDYTAKEAALHYLLPAAFRRAHAARVFNQLRDTNGYFHRFFPDRHGAGPATGHLLFYSVLIWGVTKNEWQVDANIKLWTRVVAWGMMVYTLAFLSYFVLVNCSFFNPEWDYAISFVMAMGILAVAYMGLLQRRVFPAD